VRSKRKALPVLVKKEEEDCFSIAAGGKGSPKSVSRIISSGGVPKGERGGGLLSLEGRGKDRGTGGYAEEHGFRFR